MSYIARTAGRGATDLIGVAVTWQLGNSVVMVVISSVVPIHTDFVFGRKILSCEMKRNIIPRIDHFVVSPVGEGLAQ